MDRYVLTDGVRFIAKQGNGQYVADTNEKKALILPKREAEKVLKNNLNKAFRKIFRLQKTDKEIIVETPPEPTLNMLEDKIEIEETVAAEPAVEDKGEFLTTLAEVMIEAEKYLQDDISIPKDSETETIKELFIEPVATVATEESFIEPLTIDKPVPIKKKAKSAVKETQHYDTPVKQNEQFMADMKMVASYFKDANNRKKQLQNKLEHIEKEIVDIRHYIEFKSLNACEGYNAYKMLRQRLIARRECKNELRVVEVLATGVFTTKDIVNIENIIDSFDTVTYKPRVLTDLFE